MRQRLQVLRARSERTRSFLAELPEAPGGLPTGPFVFYLAPVPSMRFEDSLTGGLLRREALQLAVLALVTAAPIPFDVRALHLIAAACW